MKRFCHSIYKSTAALMLVSGLAFISGCGGSASSILSPVVPTVPVTATGGASTVYVANQTTMNQTQILRFSASANGSATPLATITLPSGFETTAITTDSSGEIYAAGAISSGMSYQWEVLVFSAGASGAAPPVRIILGNSNSFATVVGITTDSSGQLYVAASQPSARVVVMSSTATGSAAPARVITGSATQLGPPFYGLAVDSSGTLYVANTNGASVLAFASTANGNVAPARVISGANTGFNGLYGIALDGSGNLYVMSNYEVPGVSSVTTVEEFASTANGNVAPIRTIGGSNTGLAHFVSQIKVDSAGTIFVAGDLTSNPFLLSFAATASGNAAPATSFTSTAWSGPSYDGIGLN